MSYFNQKLRNSARGEECTFAIPGICSHDPSKTVLCHLPDESHGMGMKSDDYCAAFGDFECHQVIDRKVPSSLTEEDRQFFMRRAMVRTWRRWVALGLVKFA